MKEETVLCHYHFCNTYNELHSTFSFFANVNVELCHTVPYRAQGACVTAL